MLTGGVTVMSAFAAIFGHALGISWRDASSFRARAGFGQDNIHGFKGSKRGCHETGGDGVYQGPSVLSKTFLPPQT